MIGCLEGMLFTNSGCVCVCGRMLVYMCVIQSRCTGDASLPSL